MSIVTERRGRIWILTFNRPEAFNALDVDAMKAFRKALLEFRDNQDLHVGILTGAGDRAFSAGADMKQTHPTGRSFAENYFEPYEESLERGLYVRSLDINALALGKPLIAAVNGYAVGGGMEIALACDLRIASESASFGLPEPRSGSIPAIGGTSRLLRAIPSAVAMKMLLTGSRIDASEAYRVGLVSDLVEGPVIDRAIEIAQTIVENGPLAVRAVKELARRSENLPLNEAIELEQLMWGVIRDTEDRIEGRMAFTERRPPRFQGK